VANPNFDNVILGSGIAGLTVFYYLAESTRTRNLLITNNIVSQTNTKFPLGPRFLHKSKDTEALLRRLGFPITTKEIFIGYKIGDDVRNYVTDEFKEQYVIKSRGTSKVEGSFLSGGKPSFTAYDVSQVAIGKSLLTKCLDIAKPADRNQVIINNIKNISGKKIITEKSVFYADNIISTIPLGALLNIVSDASVRFSLSASASEIVHFYLTSEKGKDVFDYIYSVTDVWYRKTYAPELDKWVYETHEPEKFESEFSDKIVDKISLRTQIPRSLNLKELGNIKLVGRYAQMNHSIKTENVIHWAHNYTRKFKNKKEKNNEKNIRHTEKVLQQD
jgi:hypothetical protein